MSHEILARRMRLLPAGTAALIVAIGVSVLAGAQRGGAQPSTPVAPSTSRATAPLDLEGYWVSVVTEDWRWRMLTPPKGEAPGVPLSREGRRVADVWDLAKDNGGGQQCKAFGAGGIMRIPGRIHITWENDTTLKMEFDAGRQTRLIHFGNAPRGEPTPQGYSAGRWQLRDDGSPILDEEATLNRGRGRGQGGQQKGSLKVVTTGMRAGYFRKNGLPYSENATLTEYFDRHDDFGTQWFTVLTVLADSRYLISPFVTTTHFKREPSGAKWSPQPCETLPPTTDRVSRGEVG